MSVDSVGVRRGSLHLGRETCERFFAGLETVILLRLDRDLVIMPVRHAAAGGYLLKHRNSRGDRIVHAADFLRANGIEDEVDLELPVVWSTERAGLVAEEALPQQT